MKVLRELFLNNIGLKAISVLLAFLLWFQIAGQQTVQRTVSLPVEFVSMPSHLEISNDYDKTVEVVIRSERGTMTFDERSLAVVINLSRSVPGTEVIPLTETNIRNKPHGVEILRMTPARIRLQLERTLRKIVEVEPELVGQPAEGFEMTGVYVSPQEVMVSGPESRVQQISSARTEPISIEGLVSPLNLNVYVDVDDPRLRIENTPSVQVQVTIEEKRRRVRVRRLPVTAVPEEIQVSFINRTVDVLGTVPLSHQEKIAAESLLVRVHVAGLEPRSEPYELAPEVELSPDLAGVFRLESVRPETVKVRVR